MMHPVGQRAADLGVVIVVDHWIVDSWCTRVRYRMVEKPFEYSVSGARLVPYYLDGETPIYLDALAVVKVRVVEEDTCEAVFGPLPYYATHAKFVVTRLHVDESQRVDVAWPTGLDPFDPHDPASDCSGVAAFHQLEDDDQSLPPEWECRGAWLFKLQVPAPPREARAPLPILEKIGPCALAVPWIDRGEHGTLIAADVVPPRLAAYGALWKDIALQGFAGAVPRLSIRADCAGEPWDFVMHGPCGTLGTRIYLEGPSCSGDVRLSVDELHGLQCDNPIEHTFDARSFENDPSFEIPFAGFGMDGRLDFTIYDIYGDGSCFIILYSVKLTSRDVAAAWLSEGHLVDGWGVEQICQEDGMQPIRDLGLQAPPGVRAMRFGLIRPERPLTLRIDAFDVQLARPVEVSVALAPV